MICPQFFIRPIEIDQADPRVNSSLSRRMISGSRNSFHLLRKARMARVPMIDWDMGMTMFLICWRWLAPSTSADSKRSPGKVFDKIPKHEDIKDLRAGDADEDERPQGVQEGQLLQQAKERHDIGDAEHKHQYQESPKACG